MNFKELATLFEKISQTTKRLEKIMILRDFYITYPKETPLLFDMLAGNYQREIGKKSLAISTKTIIDALHFVSKKTPTQIQKSYNQKGDIGVVASECFDSAKQTSLQSSDLTLESITMSFEKISKKTGSNSNKFKKEVLSQLFISAKTKNEYKFLARILVDDLRIGVSHGVIKEAMVNALFPKIINISMVCSKCKYISLNTSKCFSCNETLDQKNQEEIVEKEYSTHRCSPPKNIKALDEFIATRDEKEQLAYILRTTKSNEFILTHTPRELYNSFLLAFEKHYNTWNSFRKIAKKISGQLESILDVEIILHQPVLSMLGTRAKTPTQALESTKTPAILDYKYDGLRVQIHNEKGKVTLFSRNLENITKQFPEVVEYIKTNFSQDSFVLDSECVGYDHNKEEFLPFQTLSRRILTKNVDSVSSIRVVVKTFDVLYLNGKTLLEEPYKKRRKMMEELYLNRKIIQKSTFESSKLKKISQL